jgi:chaperonin GroES
MFTPLDDYVAILPIEPEKETSFGLIIPEVAQSAPPIGTVIAVGTGKPDNNGNLIPLLVSEGDTVLYRESPHYLRFTIEGHSCLLMKSSDLIAKL